MNERPQGHDMELSALTHGYCNDTLNDTEFKRLEQLLRGDAQARRFFRRYLGLDAALRDYGESAAGHWVAAGAAGTTNVPLPNNASASAAPLGSEGGQVTSTQDNGGVDALPLPGRQPTARRRIALTLILGLAIVAFGIIAIDRGPAEAMLVGTLEQVTGDVRLFTADGRTSAISSDVPFRAGDTVRTRGAQSSTAMVYPDGTRLTLVGDTSVTCGDGRSRSVVLHEGTLAAAVQPRQRMAPLMLATPSAQLQVLGTRFLIETAANRTDLSVTEGRVRFVRLRDGGSVEVSDGKQAFVTDQDGPFVEDVPVLRDVWEADFEQGEPEGWVYGEYVTSGLLPGSKGGLKGILDTSYDDPRHLIRSNKAWLQGLFTVRRNSHLRVTFKMDRPHWVNMFISVRTSDPRDPQFSGNYVFDRMPTVAAGQWQTISIPLTEFHRIHRGTATLEQVVPFALVFTTDAEDRGLIIDRVRVTPDGPGRIEVRPLEADAGS